MALQEGIMSDETMSKHDLSVNSSTEAQSFTGISGSSPEMKPEQAQCR